MLKIAVCGLGHVGSVVVACLLKLGHVVVGFDTDGGRRGRLRSGIPPVREPDVAPLIAGGHAVGRFLVVDESADLAGADVILVCVGTPGLPNHALDLTDVKAAVAGIGNAIRRRPAASSPVLVVIRSTMLPGSMASAVVPTIAEAAGEPPGGRYEIAYNPEFMREGTAVADYFAPARIVIGERTPGAGDRLRAVYSGIDAPVFATSFETAELVKYADNAFHALKVTFTNEIGRYARRSGIDPGEVFDIFVADTKLNLSARYLRPGGPFGGPCLPKDVRALAADMERLGIGPSVIRGILESNRRHLDFLVAEIMRRATPGARILLFGLSFKGGTGDLRESPLVELAGILLDRGFALAIYDPDLPDLPLPSAADDLTGLARLSALIVPTPPLTECFDLVVIARSDAAFSASVAGRFPVIDIDRL